MADTYDIAPIRHPREPQRTVWVMTKDGQEIVGLHGRRFFKTKRGALMALADHKEYQAENPNG